MTPPIDRLFVANKPANIGSNRFLSKIKRRYGVKKAGFSGTLDPFAKGVLIIAFGRHTRLFQFLKKAPKSYRATLWLGASSPSLDIERVNSISHPKPIDIKKIHETLESLKGTIRYLPPKFSAKQIGGKRAYELAREDKEFTLNSIESEISKIKLLNYSHPFICFEITISEGGYIRSIGEIIAQKLGLDGVLSSLQRLNEGEFVYHDEMMLDPTKYLNVEQNYYLGDKEDILLGRKLSSLKFQKSDEGQYFVICDNMLSIIEIKETRAKYLLNGVKLC